MGMWPRAPEGGLAEVGAWHPGSAHDDPVLGVMSYETLLATQQHQHQLLLRQKDAEIAHLHARMDMLQARGPEKTSEKERRVAAVLETKDEETSLMMAAKHKELELMAGLLQLREQQIEHFRSLCERQGLEAQEMQRLLTAVQSSLPNPDTLHKDSPVTTSIAKPTPGHVAGSAVAAQAEKVAEVAVVAEAAETAQALREEIKAQEEIIAAQKNKETQQEFQRLRLRLEELETAVGEQHERSAGLAQALEVKSERVEALEATVKSLRSTSAGGDGAHDEQPASSVPIVFSASPSGSAGHLPSSVPTVPSASPAESAGQLPPLPPHNRQPIEQVVAPSPMPCSTPCAVACAAPRAAPLPCRSVVCARGFEAIPLRRLPLNIPEEEGDHVPGNARGPPVMGVSPQLQSYRSHVRVDTGPPGFASQPSPWTASSWNASPSEANVHSELEDVGETGRQSEELLREMRRLRLQMGELERVAGARGRKGKPSGPDRLGVSGSSFGGESSCVGDGPAGVSGFETPAEGWRQEHAREPPVRGSDRIPSRRGPDSWTWPGGEPSAASSLQGSPQAEFVGWEYRPHPSGDELDAKIAALVNRPGRYRGWRALLCRLEPGVYLCGTRRAHLRVEESSSKGVHIEASDDGGRTWADLELLMQGAEASQCALLERARGGVGLTN